MSRFKRVDDVTATLGFGMLITAVGGIMDAYSYTVRGQVFATGQTGNLVLAAVRLMRGEYLPMLQAMTPIAAFWCGVFLAQHLLHGVFRDNAFRWRRIVLVLEVAALFLVGWIPGTVPNILANTCISLTAAVQYCCFRNFGENAAYATVFCTGNMRSCAELYYQGIVRKDRRSLRRANGYAGILLSFFAGACLSAGLSGVLGEKTIWVGCGILLIALGTLLRAERKTQ